MNLPTFRKQPADPTADGHQIDAAPTTEPIRPPREFFFGRRLAFAIDEDSIQMAAALHLGPRVKLLDATKFYLVSEQQTAESRQQLLQSTIRRYVHQHGGRRPSISLTLTGPQTALRSITVPELKTAELDAALTFEGRRQIPFPAEDCWLDTRVTEAITQGDNRRLRASVLAATKLAVQELLNPFEDLGLQTTCLYHTQDVIGQLVESLPQYRTDVNYTLINIHSRSTEIAYFRGNNLEFYHVSSLGSSFLANRTDPTVFEYFAESLATEIQNSLDFYGGQFATGQDPEIYIYGDLAYTDELIDLISDRHGLRFCRFPGNDLVLNHGPKLSPDDICVNLAAVAAAVNRGKIANLLPTPIKQAVRQKRINRMSIAALMVLGLMLISHWLASATMLSGARSRLAKLENQADQFQASEMFATYNHLKRQLTANKAFIAQTTEDPSYLGLNLKELSHQVPKPVHLYRLEFRADVSDQNYQISGLITSGSTPPELVLAEMVENLAASPFFEDIIVERHLKRRKPEGTVLDFTLSMRAIT
jgi:Tfp pilus assembly PilM family ATPase